MKTYTKGEPIFKQVLIEAFVEGEQKSVDPDQPIRFIASTEATDRWGDVVRADGWQLSNYKKNPIALFGHMHSAPVGQANAWVDGKKLMSEIKLAEAGTGPVVDYVRALVRQRILRAVSVGFMPLEDPTMIRDEKNNHITGFEFTKQDLLEISLVAVPANQEAVQVARSLALPEELIKRLFYPATRGYSAHRARLELEKIKAA